MAAQAREFIFTEKELIDASTPGGGGGGSGYGAIEVPGDFEAILRSVEDYDKTSEGKTKGMVWEYGVDGGGGEVSFFMYVADGAKSSWKRLEIFAAHGITPQPEVAFNFDPAGFVNDVVGVHIDYPRDANGDPTSNYREIRQIFAIEAAPTTETEAPTL